MRPTLRMIAFLLAIGFLATASSAQQSRPKSAKGSSNASDIETYVAKMMAFDKNKDGQLTKDEITDERLLRIFNRADANKDGITTKEELTTLAKQETVQAEGGPEFGEKKKGGFGGFGGGKEGGAKGGFGQGKEGFPKGVVQGGGFGFGFGSVGPPQPGQIMPAIVQEMLKLTDEQKKQLAELQKEVDTKMEKMLTDEQKKQFKEFRENGLRGSVGGGFGGGRPPLGGGGFVPKKDNPKEGQPKKE
jgi:hypothetical protein